MQQGMYDDVLFTVQIANILDRKVICARIETETLTYGNLQPVENSSSHIDNDRSLPPSTLCI